MNNIIEKYKEALKFLLENEHGLSIESEGEIYIRSLEGEIICVGRIEKDGGIKVEEEKIYENDFESAFLHFFTMKVNQRLGSVGIKKQENL